MALWSAPAIYRDPKCHGAGTGADAMMDGCVPTAQAMDDYEDYVNVLSTRYNGIPGSGSGPGKISHYIVWNENASSSWFDYSPVINNFGVLGADGVDPNTTKWLDKYAAGRTRPSPATRPV